MSVFESIKWNLKGHSELARLTSMACSKTQKKNYMRHKATDWKREAIQVSCKRHINSKRMSVFGKPLKGENDSTEMYKQKQTNRAAVYMM